MTASPFALNLRHLRAVLAIRHHGSISAAAEVVNLSQPALTQGLAKLEKQIGYVLFERQADGMAATPAGELVACRVTAAMDHLAVGTGRMPRGFRFPERLMTMTQVRAFLAVADAAGYVPAARTAGLSKTAVHRAVSDLEQVVGGKLVERRGRGIWLNTAGRRLAREMRLAVAEIAAAIADLGDGATGTLIRIGATPLSRSFVLPGAIARMATEQPRAHLDVVEGSWRELVEPLREGAIDLVVGGLRPLDNPDLLQLPLYEDRLIIVAGSHHPLAGDETPSLDVLAAYPWIVSRAGSPLRVRWEHLFDGRELPHFPVECGSVMIISRLLTEGDFLTLLSPDQVALQIKSGLLASVGLPLADSTRTVGVITRRDWRPTALQHRFIELLGETAARHRAGSDHNSSCVPGYADLYRRKGHLDPAS
jgi:DNA-binding transcriptional LysR family regulator